jgi:hypothetical protein
VTGAIAVTVDELLLGAETTYEVVVPPELLTSAPDLEAVARTVTLRPLVLADIQRIHKAAGDGTTLTSALMVQQAVVEPTISLEQANRLPAGLVQFLVAEINRVSGLAMGADELDESVQAPMARACFVLSRQFGWTPDECANLTIGQVLLYLEMAGRADR